MATATATAAAAVNSSSTAANAMLNAQSVSQTGSTGSTFSYLLTGYWAEHGDPRVGPLTGMSSIGPLLTLLAAYAVFVLLIGPRLMRNRKPYSLKSVLLGYNLTMSLWNAYFFYRVIFVDYNYGLDMFNVVWPSFEERTPLEMSKIHLGHIYLFSKLVDLLDTIFFVLRKKQSQVTPLHFFHHISVPFFGWVHFRLCGTNSVVIPFGLMNTFIHTIMYAYYGLAAFGPHMQKYLWWKRYITQIQIAQFVLLFSYGVFFSVFQQGYAPFFTYNTLIQSVIYMVLFSQFYYRTYKAAQKKAQMTKDNEVLSNGNDSNNNNSHSNGLSAIKEKPKDQ